MIDLKKKYIILGIVAIFILWLFAIIMHGKKSEKLRAEYQLIQNKDEINAKLLKLKKIKGTCYLKTINSSLSLLSSQNYLYQDEYIHNNLFIGDSISKNAMSDTIYIFSKKGGVKYFVHKKVINRPSR